MSQIHPFLKPVADMAAEDASTKSEVAKNDAATAVASASQATAKAAQAMQAAAATPSRIRTKRVAVPAVAVGASQVVQVVWDTPFPSVNYTVPRPGVVGSASVDVQVTNKTVAGCTVSIKNTGIGALLASAATLEILAIHDPLA